MDKKMMASCGAYCGDCAWVESTGCPGCQTCAGQMFYGQCDKAECCIAKGYTHCGECPELPCQLLLDLFADPEHGDDGQRLRNLRSWAEGREIFERLPRREIAATPEP